MRQLIVVACGILALSACQDQQDHPGKPYLAKMTAWIAGEHGNATPTSYAFEDTTNSRWYWYVDGKNPKWVEGSAPDPTMGGSDVIQANINVDDQGVPLTPPQEVSRWSAPDPDTTTDAAPDTNAA